VAINRLNPDYPDAGLVQVSPTSVSVGSGSGSVDGNGAVTFSGASSVTLNGIFSSAYDNYRFIVSGGTGSQAASIYASLGGITTGYFSHLNYGNFANTNTARANSGTQSLWLWLGGSSTTGQESIFDLLSPFLTKPKFIHAVFYKMDAGDLGHMWGYNNSTTSATACTLSPDAGTFSGTVRVYGYRN